MYRFALIAAKCSLIRGKSWRLLPAQRRNALGGRADRSSIVVKVYQPPIADPKGILLPRAIVTFVTLSYLGPPASLRNQIGLFLLVRPAGRTHLEVKVLYTPGKGKC
jgi:hypothetical protein